MSKNDPLIEKACQQRNCRQLRQMLLITLLALVYLPVTVASHPPLTTPRLTADNDIASAGFFRLSWETDAERVELQEASDPEFRNPTTSYRGPDRAAVISGKPDGSWYYRIREFNTQQAGPWSEPFVVTVVHHSLSRAFGFLTLGVMVFVAILLVIVRGPGKTA